MTSPWLTPAQAAMYLGFRTVKAFNSWTQRRGIRPDGLRGRVRLFLPNSLDRVLQLDARRPFQKAS